MKNRKEGYRFWRLEEDLPALGTWMGWFGGSCGIQEKKWIKDDFELLSPVQDHLEVYQPRQCFSHTISFT